MLAGVMLFGAAPAHLESSNTSHAARPARDRTALVSRMSIDAARRFARSRQGVVAFAVLEEGGRPRGLRRTVRFGSASVSKAMLLVSYLRRVGGRHLSVNERALLRPMIVVSDNNAADAIYGQVGGNGLRTVARAAGMHRFSDVGHWANAQITAADQSRFFLRIDRLVPTTHRRYARMLLSSIVGPQRWGIPVVARRHRLKAFFKGGWRAGISHQVALLQSRHGGRRLALAILTSGTPSDAYGHETIERVAARVLRDSSKR
jgi:hypothetical protein